MEFSFEFAFPILEILFYSGRSYIIHLSHEVSENNKENTSSKEFNNLNIKWMQKVSKFTNSHKNSRFQETLDQLIDISEEHGNYSQNHKLNNLILLNNIGVIYYELGEFVLGSQFLQRALDLSENDRNLLTTGILINNLAYQKFRFSKFETALKLLSSSLEYKRNLPPFSQNSSIVSTLYNKGALFFKIASYQQSLDTLVDSLSLHKKTEREFSCFVAVIENLMALIYKTLGQYNKAKEICEKNLKVLQEKLNTDHPEIATLYHTLGTIYFALGEYDESLKYHEKSLDIREKIYGKNHPLTAYSIHSVGNVYHLKDNPQVAINNYEIALNIRLNIFGEENIEVGVAYSDIGQAYCNIENYPKAIKFLELAMSIYKNCLQEDHPDIGTCYNNLGIIYEKLGQPEKALEYLQLCNQIYKKIKGVFLPIIGINLNNMGSVYYLLGQADMAIKTFEESIEILSQSFQDGHPDIALGYGNLGFIYEELQDYRNSIYNYLKSIKCMKKIKQEESERVSWLTQRIATIAEQVKNKGEALKVFKRAYSLQRKNQISFRENMITSHIDHLEKNFSLIQDIL